MFAVIRFGLLTVRYAGLRVALRKLGHQIYGRTVFLYCGREIKSLNSTSKFPCYTILASEEDVKEFFNQMQYETNDGKYHILVRKWYHERGLGIPCVQKTLDTNEVCGIRWVVTAQSIRKAGYDDRFPNLQEDEAIPENAYVIERFRGKGVLSSNQTAEILKSMGIKRVVTFVAEDNTPELKYLKKIDCRVFGRVYERHFLFHVTRKTLEDYNPPIPIAAMPDINREKQ